MNKKKVLVGVLVLALSLLLWTVVMTQAQSPQTEGIKVGDAPQDIKEADAVGRFIPVQGQLTDAGGSPLDGSYSVAFRLYDSLTAGNLVCQDTNSVDVNDGLFYSQVGGNCTASDINGQQLYLAIEVESDGEMVERQPIYPVPYAWSLRPGAEISGSISPGAILHIENWGESGRGVRSYAMDEQGINYGLVGASRSPNGYGGYIYNNGAGVGLYAFTTGSSSYAVVGLQADMSLDDYDGYFQSGGFFAGEHGVIGVCSNTVRAGAGVYGLDLSASGTSYGVYGKTDSSNGRGVFGHAMAESGITYGVYGQSQSEDGRGVYGHADANTGTGYGVYGKSDASNGRGAYGGATNAEGGVGVEGESAIGTGVYGQSAEGFGVYGSTEAASHDYGFYTPDNLSSLNFHSRGAKMQVVLNGGAEPLESGDVVAFSGIIAPAQANEPPTIQVAKATSANSTAIAGVVYSGFNAKAVNQDPSKVDLEITPTGPVQPGEYLLVVIQGPVQVKVSALTGDIQTGDLISSGGQAGYAAQAAQVTTLDNIKIAIPGTVLGKALESSQGREFIYVFVTLQ